MRTIKGWTNEEIKALKRLKEDGYEVYDVFFPLAYGSSDNVLKNKFNSSFQPEGSQIILDIVDFWRGDAKFPEKKYRIKLPVRAEPSFGYLNDDGELTLVSGSEIEIGDNERTIFTMDEIKQIDERLVPFAADVEE